MKVVLDPITGAVLALSGRDPNSDRVYFCIRRRLGQHSRRYVVPHNPRTSSQRRLRKILGALSKEWNALLTPPQRAAWNAYAEKVMSRWRLGCGPLSGQQLYIKLNSVLWFLGRPRRLWPPRRAKFYRNPVAGLQLSRGEDGRVCLELVVAWPVRRDLMVFGAAPCSAGWSKLRHPVYLGLLPARGGRAGDLAERRFDITDWYVGRFGEPEPRQRVFIRVRQQRNGWESANKDVNDVVPAQRAAPPPQVQFSPPAQRGAPPPRVPFPAPSRETFPPAFSPILAPLGLGVVNPFRPVLSQWTHHTQEPCTRGMRDTLALATRLGHFAFWGAARPLAAPPSGGFRPLGTVRRAFSSCAQAGKRPKSHRRHLWRGG